jgi:hypothetical protein
VPFGHVVCRRLLADGAQIEDRVTQLVELDDLPDRSVLPHVPFIAGGRAFDTGGRAIGPEPRRPRPWPSV